MTAIANINLADITDLSQPKWALYAQDQLRSESRCQILVPESRRIALSHATSLKFPSFSGLGGLRTLADNAASLTFDTPSESPVTITAAQVYSATKMTSWVNQAGTVGSLYDFLVGTYASAAAEDWDNLVLTAAVAGTAHTHVGQSTRGAITTSDKITLAAIRAGVLALKNAKVRPFPGLGLYVCVLTPTQANHLRTESNGIIFAQLATNAPELRTGVIGAAEGCLFIESTSSSLVDATGGSGGIPVHLAVIFGAEAMGGVYVPIEAPPAGVTQVSVMTNQDPFGGYPAGSLDTLAVRIARPASNLGLYAEVGLVGQLGFGLNRDAATYRIESYGG